MRKAVTIGKRPIFNTLHPVLNCYVSEILAIVKSKRVNNLNVLRNYNAPDFAADKCANSYFSYAFGNNFILTSAPTLIEHSAIVFGIN